MYRWVALGAKNHDPCPLAMPAKMPGWLSRNMPRGHVSARIEQAALDAARGTTPPVTEPDPQPPSTEPIAKSIRLEDFDPEEGDRLRELKQIQLVKFTELKAAMLAGGDTTLLTTRYIKFSEDLDKIESRVIERMKKRGLYVLRDQVERDLAGNAELLRQTRESMPRRVLEQCASLTADQRLEVTAAILRARAREDSILCKLDVLKTDDLLRELAA